MVASFLAVNAFMKRCGHIVSPMALARIAVEYAPQLQGAPLPSRPGNDSSSGRSARICSNIGPTPPYMW